MNQLNQQPAAATRETFIMRKGKAHKQLVIEAPMELINMINECATVRQTYKKNIVLSALMEYTHKILRNAKAN